MAMVRIICEKCPACGYEFTPDNSPHFDWEKPRPVEVIRRWSADGTLVCSQCHEAGRSLYVTEPVEREEHESFPPEREWARGIDCG